PPSDEFVEPSGPYPELVGCLMYLMTCTRPDLAYPLSLLARYVAPGRHRKVHWDAAKRVLRYLCSTSGMGLVHGGRARVVLTGHADASWVDDLATQRSSQGYKFSLGSGSVSWRSTRSSSVLSSSCEAEIYAGAMAAQELRWLTYLLTDLGEAPRSPPVLRLTGASRAACRLANPAELVPPIIPAALRWRLIPAAMATAAFPSLSSTVAPAPSALWSANLTVSFPALPCRRTIAASPICVLFPPPVPSQTQRLSLAGGSTLSPFSSSPFPVLSPLLSPHTAQLPLFPRPQAPYPTNAPWQNFVLGQGGNPELVTPYIVQSAEGHVAWGLPMRDPQPGYIVQAFITTLMLSTLQGLPPPPALHLQRPLRHPLLPPTLLRALRSPRARGPPGVEASSNSTKYRVALNNGQVSPPHQRLPAPHSRVSFSHRPCYLPHPLALKLPVIESPHSLTVCINHHLFSALLSPFPSHQTWLVYLSSPLALRQDGSALVADAPFTGTMRVALLPGSSAQDEDVLLDAHVPTVPVGGECAVHRRMEVSAHSPSTASALRRRRSGSPSGVMSALRGHHNPASAGPSNTRGGARWSSVRDASVPDASVLAYPTIDGQAMGMQGGVWRFNVPKRPSTWQAGPLSSDAQLLDELRGSLKQDVAALPPLSSPSTYSFGKAAARAARLALIAKQVQDDDSLAAVLPPLRTALSAWLDGTFPGNHLLYDPTWGGVVSEAGSLDQGAEFGAGMYNDHHFHYGYFIYAAATVAEFDAAWRDQYRAPLRDLMADYMSLERTAAFPRLRHFDAYALEAANAYYAGALLASVLGDQPLATLGATLAAVEALAGQTLMHVPLASSNPDPSLTPGYKAVFADANRVVGVLWSTKSDAGLWFAPLADMEKRVGIQVLPVSPFLTHPPTHPGGHG
ncbi:unnamed protein product, partial [Closterium sp. NIES-54]